MSKNVRTALSALVLVAAAGLTACKSDNAAKTNDAAMEAKATPMNTTCPYTGGKVNPAVTSAHEGKTVGFCCAGCKGKFDKADDATQDAMVAKAK